jgi:predicted phage tail protein
MGLPLKGRKSSSSSKKATRHDDNLFGQDTVEILLAVGEGPMDGLVDGAASFEVGDVPLLDKGSQTPNISNFELRFLKGTNPADSILPNLGGLGSTKNIGLELRTQNQSIVAQGDKNQIDYIDVRFVVQRLISVTKEGGEFPTDVQFKVEVKRRSSSTWEIPFSNEPPPPVENTSGGSNYRPGTSTPGTVVNDAYRETYTAAAAPTGAKAVDAVWFDTSTQYWTPSLWNGSAWVAPANRAQGNRNGYVIWTWNESDGDARTAWFSPSGTAPPPGTLAAGDFLITPQSGSTVYAYNDTSWVAFQNWNQVPTAAPGVITINGLARSSYPKEYRIPVKRINEPYDVRVTRLSPNSTKDIYRDITFESIQEVIQSTFSFPDLAIAWLTIKATDTFTSIPEFTGTYRGIIIPVPSNYTYNPVTKLGEYSGLWDGTFKMAYTNSPSWHAYNLITNSRYGKNAYYPEIPDKWDYYEFGKHCDLHGLRFNEYISEPRSINELINYIVGLAGGRYVDRGDGYSTVIWDADDQIALALFTPENVVDGNFTYSFTDITERKNDFKVSFKNPQLNYREDRVRVWDQNGIDVNGRNAEEFVAVGCRDPEEAVRRGRLRLATSLTEKTIVNFKTTRLGRYLVPFGIILVGDPLSNNTITGRIRNPDVLPAGTTTLPLRDQIYLEAGISYSIQLMASDNNGGTKIVTYPLSVTTPGQQTELKLARATAEALSEYATFIIGAPKAFRVTSFAPDDTDPDIVDVTAIEVNRQKWAFVDGKVELRDILATQTGPLSKFVYPVSSATIVPETTLDGHFNLVVKWGATETKLNRGYRIYQSLNGQQMTLIGETNDLQFRINDAQAATYMITITAVGLDGTTESAPVTVQYIVSDGTSLRSVAPPTNPRLVDEPEAPIFRAVDPRFTWDAAADALVTKYLVEVVGPSNNVVHSERVEGQLAFQYTLAANKADNGGTPLRQFTVRVTSIDSTGNLSTPVSLVVSHPAPAALAFQLDAVSENVFVSYTPPATGYAGVLIWMETVDGFNPLTTTPRYDGLNTFVSLPAKRDTNYYVRIAAYDSYGKTGLNISEQKRIFTSIKLFDPNGPAQPTGLALSTAPVILADGTVMASITATWDAPLATDTAYGQPEIEFGEGTGLGVSFIADRVPADQRTWTRGGFRPGITYSVRLRFRPNATALGLGPYTVIQTIVAALNLTPPGNPSNVVVTTGFGFNAITLSLPANKDLKHIEVWAVVGNNASATPAGGATLIGRIADASTQYFDYAVTGQQKTYWLRAVNTSDVVATSYVRVLSSVSPQIQAAQLAAQIIDDTKVATALLTNVPKPLASVPTTKDREIILVSGKLYRWDATANAYTAAVQAVDVGYGLTSEQLVSVQAAKVAGTLSDAQLAGIAAAKLIGSVVDTQIAGLSASKLAGQVTSDQIATLQATKVAGTLSDAQLAGISSNKLIGSVVDAQIAGIAAAKVAGQLTNEQIATLAATKISGTLSDTQLAGISAGKLIGSIVDSQLVGITAGKVTGQLTDAQLAGLSAAKVSGQLTSGQIASLDAVKLSGQIVSAQLADAAVTLAKFGTGTQPIATVAGLPSPTNYTGALTLLNTNDGKIYRYISGAWQSWTAAGDITGTIQAGQIAALEASKITGQLTDAQLSALSAAKVSGQLSNAQLAGIDAAKLIGSVVSGQISSLDAAKIANQLTSAQIASLDATKVAGQLSNAQLAGIDANKLIGQVVAAQVASVNAAAVGAGLTSAQISSVNATAVSGQLSNAQLAGIDAGKLIGSVVDSQLAAISAGKVTGQLTDAQLAGLSAAKLAGQITGTQITDSAVSTAKLAAGAVIADRIAAGAITTSKLTIASTNLMLNSNGALMSRVTGNQLGLTVNGNSSAVAPVLYRDARYAGPGTYSFLMRMTGTPAANTVTDMNLCGVDTAGSPTSRVAVQGGQRYEASVYVTTFNCSAVLYIDSYDSAGTTIRREYTSGAFGPLGVPTRLGGFFTVPANATSIGFRIRATWDGGTNYHLFVAAPMLATVVAGQTELSPYFDSGVTVMDGSSITTGSIAADRVVANSLTSAQIQAGGIAADRIVANSLTAGQLAADAVTAGKIAAGAISAREIVAGSITGDRITSNTIVGTQIVANTIGTREIIANVITTNQIAAGGVNADRLVANSITANQIAANAITAGKIDAGAITAREVAAGSIVASKLQVASTNQIFNGDLSQGTLGFTGPNLTIRTDFAPAGFRCLQTFRGGTPTAGSYEDVTFGQADANGSILPYLVTAGNTYELSVYASAHRCTAQVYFEWQNASGGVISFTGAGGDVPSNGAVGGPLKTFPRCVLFGTAPANCTKVVLRGRMLYTGGTDCYVFWSALQFANAVAGQTEASPWMRPGLTTIDGGQLLTDSIGARQIIANSITASEIAGRTITADKIVGQSITAAEIAANTITGDRISGRTVTADKLVANSITANEIAANSITAGQIAVRTITAANLVAGAITAYEIAGGTITGDKITGNTISGTNLLAETIGSREIITRVITADKIAGGTISAYEIASRTIVAGNIVAGALTAYEIAARTITATNLVSGTITANEIASRTITAGLISAGTLTATEIAAGAITASKLTIGSGNFCINSNGFQVNAQTGLQLGANVSNANLQPLRTDNAFYGTYPFCIRPIGTPAAGSFSFVEFNMLDAAGNPVKRHPVQGGQRYEFSAYVSGYDAQQTVLFVDFIASDGSSTRGYTEQRAGSAAVTRYGGFAVAPTNAVSVVLRVGAYWNGGTNGHLFVSAPLMAGAPAGINELSPWTNSGVTQIDGSTIRTGSIEAVQIRAGSITAGLLAARTITSAQIAAGTISTTEIGAGQITGEKISAGTLTAREIAGGAITAGKLTVANRNLNITGLNIRYVVATRRIEWDGANIYYIDDNGAAQGATVTPGGFTVNGNSWYSVLWYQGRTYLDWQTDINYGMNNPGFVTIATYDNGNGLDVRYGSTIIDGARIVTNSILADKIVAGAITAREIAVRTIDATKIVGGTIGAYEIGAAVITGEKISAGAISAREIAAGSILASKIAVASNNLLSNGGLLLGSAGWSASHSARTYIAPEWGRGGNPAYAANWAQWTDGSAHEVYAFAPDVNGTGQRTRVSPSTWYEASSYISAHRCTGVIAVIFWREDGTYAGEVGGNTIDQQAPSSGSTQDFWDSNCRSWKVFQTPSDCRFVDVRFRVYCRATDPYAFINSVMLATCKANQAEPSPYVSPGATVIDGNAVLTDSIGARQIVANSITATEIAGRTITADRIQVGAISADELGVNSVTAVKIGVRQIDATKLVGYTITAYEISSQAIDARTIKADAIEGYHIKADTIGSREIIANSITAGEIQAGAIGVDQLAAGAITADKIGVGLNSGNLIFNSDLMAGNVGLAYGFTSQPNMFIGVAGIGEANTPWGMASAYINHSGSPNGTYGDISFRSYRADGFIRERTPVQAGKRYEISCYVSCFRHAGADIGVACYDGNGNLVADFHSGRVNGTSGGQLNYWVRATMMFDMPGTVTDVVPYIRSYYNGQASPHTFVSGFFFAAASPKQTQFSDWSPAAYTVISGGQIATNTLSADKIIAGTITTDKLLAGSINADRMEITSLKARVLAAGAVTADTLTVGNGNLASLISGSNSTKINGASISTNSIRASQVQIGMRGLNVIGVNMRYVVATRRVEWDAGAIFWVNNDGNLQSVSTTGGSFQPSGNDWYSILWYQGRTYFDYNSDVNFAINTGDPNWVTLATYDNGTGLSVNFGSTIIDGDRIVTGSIKADRIGANQIQASHISAGAITADKIGAGAVSADKISAGNITAETILIGGNCMRLWTDSNGGRIAMLNAESNQWRAVFGNLGPWGYGATDYGLVCWNGSGSEVLRVSSNGTRINGAIIDAASIGSAQIGALTVKSAHIENLTIGNGKVASGGITTVVSANSAANSPNSAGVNIYKRDGKFQVYVFMRGNGVTTTLLQAGTQTGTLSVYAQGDNFGRTLIEAINMPIATIWRAQDGGNHVYTSPFGYSFTWAGNGSQNYYFTVEYNGSLANTGVAIHVSEISK